MSAFVAADDRFSFCSNLQYHSSLFVL